MSLFTHLNLFENRNIIISVALSFFSGAVQHITPQNIQNWSTLVIFSTSKTKFFSEYLTPSVTKLSLNLTELLFPELHAIYFVKTGSSLE